MHRNILVAAGLYPPDIGGPATYARMIELGLPERGIAITVLPFGTVRHLPKLIRHLVYAYRLYKASKDVDALYALDSVSVGVPAYLIARLRKKPLLVRLGGDYAWEQGRQRLGVTDTLDQYTADRAKQGRRVRWLAHVQDVVVRNAQCVVVPSEYLASVVRTWPGVSATRVQVVYSALFPLSVEGPRESLRSQLNYEAYTIISVARLVPWKGFQVLIDAFASLEDTTVTLVIAGDGPERAMLEAHAAASGAVERIRFVGSLSKDALGAAVKAADLFVLNTGYEGLSHQLLEVMDLGVPVVTTDVGGNPELITDGVHGLLVPYNNEATLRSAIERAIANPDLQQHWVQNARLRTADFNREKVLDELAETISTVLSDS